MSQFIEILRNDMFAPNSLFGAVFYGVMFLGIATILSNFLRRVGKRAESHFMDVTGLRFAISLIQVLVFLLAFVLYVHLIPELRSLGTAVLTGVSLTSLVLGLSAQTTLSNLIAGVSLVPYRPIRVGDNLRLNTPNGPDNGKDGSVSLGYTQRRDTDDNRVIVPNSAMMGTIMIRMKDRQS